MVELTCRVTRVSPWSPTSLIQSMPRASKMAARAARRATTALPNLPRTRKSSAIPYSTPRRTCPYCSKTLASLADRDRHILLRPYCRSRHMLTPSPELMKRRKRKREENEGPDQGERYGTGPDATPPPSKVPNIDGTAPSNQPTEPCEADAGGERESGVGGEHICAEPFVEHFPIDTAGEPISTETAPKKDLRTYLDSCGRLRDPELFETAELLMMTVPKGKDRTKHLQSKMVSSLQARNSQILSVR